MVCSRKTGAVVPTFAAGDELIGVNLKTVIDLNSDPSSSSRRHAALPRRPLHASSLQDASRRLRAPRAGSWASRAHSRTQPTVTRPRRPRPSIRRATCFPGGQGWRAIVSLGRDPATGKRRQLSKTFANREKAEAWLKENRAKRAASTAGSTGELFDRWLINQRHRYESGKLSASTLSWYSSAISKHLRPSLGSIPAAKVTSSQLQTLIASKVGKDFKRSLRRLTVVLPGGVQLCGVGGMVTAQPSISLGGCPTSR